MKKNLKKTALVLLAIVCFAAGVWAVPKTYSYLVSKQTASNPFEVVKNEISINENFNEPEDIRPGDVITKEPAVRNTGNTAVFVRMRAVFSSSDMEEYCEPLVISGDWYYNSADQYYYYTKILNPGESTTPLFTQVAVKSDAPENKLQSFDILIYSESKDTSGHTGSSTSATGFSELW